jgi:hypothetical protein
MAALLMKAQWKVFDRSALAPSYPIGRSFPLSFLASMQRRKAAAIILEAP